MKNKHLLFMGGVLLLLGSCSSVKQFDEVDVPMPLGERSIPVKFSERDVPVKLASGQVNTVKPGERFEIRLVGNPTTGYCWMIDNEKSLEHVKFVSEKRVAVPRDPERAGGPPRPFVFVFDAVSPGRDKIVMAYRRLWEKKAPIETKEFEVEVAR